MTFDIWSGSPNLETAIMFPEGKERSTQTASYAYVGAGACTAEQSAPGHEYNRQLDKLK